MNVWFRLLWLYLRGPDGNIPTERLLRSMQASELRPPQPPPEFA